MLSCVSYVNERKEHGDSELTLLYHDIAAPCYLGTGRVSSCTFPVSTSQKVSIDRSIWKKPNVSNDDGEPHRVVAANCSCEPQTGYA